MSTNFYAIKLFVEALLSKYCDVKSQKGVTMIEYALIAALVAVVAIGAITALGGSIQSTFQSISDAITNSGSSSGS